MSRDSDYKMAATTRRMWEMLTDEWQLLSDIKEQTVLTVPPGRALRRYNQRQARRRETVQVDLTKSTRPELTEAEKILVGARTFVQEAVRSLTQSGRAEIRTTEWGDKFIRRVPEDPPVPAPETRVTPRSVIVGNVIYPNVPTWTSEGITQEWWKSLMSPPSTRNDSQP